MVCKAKGCNNSEETGFKYCEKHLCRLHKKAGGRCRKRVLGNTGFCVFHQYHNTKVTIIGILLAILSIALLALPTPIHYLIWGGLIIDFREDMVFEDKEPHYVKIEVINEFGRTLNDVRGEITLECFGGDFKKKSQTFILEGYHKMLSSGSKAEFLFSPDPFFINLVNTKNRKCAEAHFLVLEYQRINETHRELKSIDLFNIFEDDFEIVREPYDNLSEEKIVYNCLTCDVGINIYTAEKDFSKTEKNHKFTGGGSKIASFEIVNPIPEGFILKDYYYRTPFEIIRNVNTGESLFKPCKGLTEEECWALLCKKIEEQYYEPDRLACISPSFGKLITQPFIEGGEIKFESGEVKFDE